MVLQYHKYCPQWPFQMLLFENYAGRKGPRSWFSITKSCFLKAHTKGASKYSCTSASIGVLLLEPLRITKPVDNKICWFGQNSPQRGWMELCSSCVPRAFHGFWKAGNQHFQFLAENQTCQFFAFLKSQKVSWGFGNCGGFPRIEAQPNPQVCNLRFIKTAGPESIDKSAGPVFPVT